MHQRHPHTLKSLLHPYIFVLKEGQRFKKNLLDYSLTMLYIHSTETIKSPENFILSIEDIEPYNQEF